jgi:aryl sulfotransferase
MTIPGRTRRYQNHTLDSDRWDAFEPRSGDIVIDTSFKAGTTWMQRIVSLLIFGPDPLPKSLDSLSPWIDRRSQPAASAAEFARLSAQVHRRFVKSHLPLDAMPYYSDLFYIWLSRDTRDVFMSVWHHYHSLTPAAFRLLALNSPDGSHLPPCPETPQALWREWMTHSSFEWERDGWPFWSHHYNAASFWPFRHLPNIICVHFADLLADLGAEMRRIAEFLCVEVPLARWPALVRAARFDAMRAEAIRTDRNGAWAKTFTGGAAGFFFRGTNGRWRSVVSGDDLALYERGVASLGSDLRVWLENGRLGAIRGGLA